MKFLGLEFLLSLPVFVLFNSLNSNNSTGECNDDMLMLDIEPVIKFVDGLLVKLFDDRFILLLLLF